MQELSITALVIILIVLIICAAFFSIAETGMMALNRYRLRYLSRKKHRAAMRVSRLLERIDRLLGVILIGSTFANIFASAVATILAVRLWGNLGVLIATAGLTLVMLIFAEIAPKTVAALFPQRTAFLVALPLQLLLKILYPLVWIANVIASGVLRMFGINLQHKRVEHLSGEELRTVVYEAGSLIPQQHKDMLLSILDLEKVFVEDIMVPRNDIVGINMNEPWEEILQQLESCQHTRLPLYSNDINHVQGIVHMRDVLSLIVDEDLTKETLIKIALPCYFVPEGTPLHKQLLNFQKAKSRSGLVVDEYGDVQGLVTLEDILEEIVGEFTTDIAAISKDINAQDDGSVIVDGSTSVRELNRVMKWKLPSTGPRTINGLIIEYLQDIPSSETSIMINRYAFEVLLMKDNRVKTVRIKKVVKKK